MSDIPTQWNDAMIASVQRSHRAVLQMQQTSETKLLAIYRRAAENVGNRVLAMGPDADLRWLNSLMGQLEERIKALSERGSALVQQVKNRTFRAGVADTHRAITILPTVTLHDLALGPVQVMLDRVYHDAALALTTDVYGVKLSDLIWRSHQVTLTDMRRFMVDGMLGGKTPAELYQQMKAFLVLPDVDMRTRYWKQYFRENPPGKGRYRSAYKNVRRVLRTETNRAYRNATAAYARDKSWAQGVRWVLSYNHPEMDVCLGGWGKIETQRGRIAIADVRRGDYVLTHQMRYRPIIRTMQRTIRDGQIVVIACRTAQDRIRVLTLTPNHPVLSGREWIPAGDLKAGTMIVDRGVSRGDMQHEGTCDVDGKAWQDFERNAPSPKPRNGAGGLCDVVPPVGRTFRICGQDVPVPNASRMSGIVSARFHGTLLANWDSRCHDGLQRVVCERRQTVGTYQDGACRNWDCLNHGYHNRHGNSEFVSWNSMMSRKICHTPGRSAVLQRDLSGSRLTNKNDDSRRALRRTSFHIPRTSPGSDLSVLERNTFYCKTAILRNEKDVRVWEKEVCRKARMFVSYIQNSMPRRNMQEVLGVAVGTVADLTVYNLAVAEDNSYIANGVAVHNCDYYATEDMGMGPGVWSVEAVPDSGHPQCLCHLVVEINPAYLPQTEAPPPHPKPRPVPAEGPYAVPAT